MTKYRLTGNYGTFVISRIVEINEDAVVAELGPDATDEELQDAIDSDVFEQGGITTTLEEAGWTMEYAPDGEEWEVERL